MVFTLIICNVSFVWHTHSIFYCSDPAVMAESAAVDSEAEASAVAVEATASSQREENLTKYKR